jgi:hypothetical protein
LPGGGDCDFKSLLTLFLAKLGLFLVGDPNNPVFIRVALTASEAFTLICFLPVPLLLRVD